MKSEDAHLLLERIGMLRQRSDLDLLIFFARHPRSLLASETLAAFLGYDLNAIADSLETLLAAGLLKRTQSPAHAARMYVFAAEGPSGGWLPSLIRMASTRQGRLALIDALVRRPQDGASPVQGRLRGKTGDKAGPLGLVPAPTRETDRNQRRMARQGEP